jgi:AcrR family transcriptional regulator
VPKVSDSHLQSRRQAILHAAATCFARDGFHRTSMHDIVRESGVSAGLIYRYFAGKDDMIAAIVTEWHEDRATRLRSTSDAEALVPTYLDLLRAIGEPEAADALRLSVQVWAEALRDARIRDLVRGGMAGPRSAAVAAIRSAQGSGELSPDVDPDALARILIAIFQGLTLQTAWADDVDNPVFVHTVAVVLESLRPASD